MTVKTLLAVATTAILAGCSPKDALVGRYVLETNDPALKNQEIDLEKGFRFKYLGVFANGRWRRGDRSVVLAPKEKCVALEQLVNGHEKPGKAWPVAFELPNFESELDLTTSSGRVMRFVRMK